MKTRIITAALLLPLCFAILFFFPPYILAATISIIAAIGSYELFKASNNITSPKDKTKAPMRPVVYAIIIASLVPLAMYFSNILLASAALMQAVSMMTLFFVLLSLLAIDFLLNPKAGRRIKLRQLPVIFIAALVIPYMLSTLLTLRMMTAGHLLVLIPILISIVTDSGAYFTGVFIGKHKAFPKISPNKTVEGYIGGFISGIVGVLIYGVILDLATQHTINYPVLIIYGLTGAVISELGDLVFSLIKRKCGVKDYGNLIPGHGGVLDRFDSMIFCIPVVYLLVAFLPFL